MSQSRNTQSSLFNKNFFCPEIIQNSQALLRNKNNMELYSWETDGEEVHLITELCYIDLITECNKALTKRNSNT